MFAKSWIIVSALGLAGMLCPTQAGAYELSPIVIQLSPAGGGSVQSMVITNTHEVPIAIQVEAHRREQLPDGTEQREIEEEDLLITPPQMVIAPGSSQSFNVRWVGPPDIQTEQAYRIITEQVPIVIDREQRNDFTAQVSMQYRYEAALYVVPSGAQPLARVVGARPVSESGNQWLELDIASEGKTRAILQEPSLAVSAPGGGEVNLTGEAVAALDGLNILAGNHRIVRLPWPEGVPVGDVQVRLDSRLLVLR